MATIVAPHAGGGNTTFLAVTNFITVAALVALVSNRLTKALYSCRLLLATRLDDVCAY